MKTRRLEAAAIVLVGAMFGVAPNALGDPPPPCSGPNANGIVRCDGGVESSYLVPADGVLHVTAVGGSGGGTSGVFGGLAAIVIGDVPVTGGTTLYVEVPSHSAASFNGGGAGGHGPGANGGYGGGASDVRTCTIQSGQPSSCGALSGGGGDPRLIVAGGGGGAGLV